MDRGTRGRTHRRCAVASPRSKNRSRQRDSTALLVRRSDDGHLYQDRSPQADPRLPIRDSSTLVAADRCPAARSARFVAGTFGTGHELGVSSWATCLDLLYEDQGPGAAATTPWQGGRSETTPSLRRHVRRSLRGRRHRPPAVGPADYVLQVIWRNKLRRAPKYRSALLSRMQTTPDCRDERVGLNRRSAATTSWVRGT